MRHWVRIAGLAALIAAGGLSVAGCRTPEFLRDPAPGEPLKWSSAEGFTTEEVLYRGWDHSFRVTDGAVEMIFVPAIGRLMRFAPVSAAAVGSPAEGAGNEPAAEPGATIATTPPGAQPTRGSSADMRDGTNLLWVNPKWTGLVPSPFQTPLRLRPREYPLYGGVSHWPGPQEKWPTSPAPDRRKLVDVEVPWPPDPGTDLVPFKLESGDAGRVSFVSAGLATTGVRARVAVEAMAANKGVIDFHFSQTNETKAAVEASSWLTVPLQTRGYLALRRDQLVTEPAQWPVETTFSGPWAILTLNARPPMGFALEILPAAGSTAHVVILQGSSVYALQVLRPAAGEYPPGRTTMTIRKAVVGCPPQVELLDPESDQHYVVAACSPLAVLEPGVAVDLKIRLVSKGVTDFYRDDLAQYLAGAVGSEKIRELPTPVIDGEQGFGPQPAPKLNPTPEPGLPDNLPPPNGPAMVIPPPDAAGPPPPLPDAPEDHDSPSIRPPEDAPPVAPKPPADPNLPPQMGPVNQ